MLTDVKARQSKAGTKTIKLADSHGLLLEVKPNGAKSWRYRYKIDGKENTFAIGNYPEISLQDARAARDAARLLVKQGIHPAHARQAERVKNVEGNASTFEAIAEEWLAANRPHWSPRYYEQIAKTFAADVYPALGRLPIRSITSAGIKAMLDKIVARGSVAVAINCRQWVSAVFRFAVASLRADGDPVGALRGGIIRPKVENARPMNREQLGEFMGRLAGYGGRRSTVIALWLLLYTFVRTVEMRRAEWVEFDLDAGLWTIPEGKMKMRRAHIVPLSRQMVELLRELRSSTGGRGLLFTNSRRPGEMMSGTTINRVLQYLGVPFSGHDFRATASTHLYEMGYEEKLVEMQLAHAEGNKVKAAYNHARHLPERRAMMQAWADWLEGIMPKGDRSRSGG